MRAVLTRSQSLRWATALLPVVLVTWIAANSLNYVTPLRPGPDAGEYASGGMMLRDGRLLYRDMMEVKPPMIYVLDALALDAGDGTFRSIRVLERIFALAGVLLVYFLALTLLGSRPLAVLAAIAFSFHAYSNGVLEEGNVTEEYAVVFALAGMLCAVRAAKHATPLSRPFGALAGLCFSCAVLTKEPFVFSSVPWFIWLLLVPPVTLRSAMNRGGVFLLGALVPAAVFVGYLIVNGGVLAWLDKLTASVNYVAASRGPGSVLAQFEPIIGTLNSRVLLVTWTGALALGAGVLSAAFPAFLEKHRYAPLLVLAAFLMEFLGAAWSSRPYGHYLIQMMPSFVLCCAMGGALVVHGCGRVIDGQGRWGLLLVLILVPGLLHRPAVADYWRRLNEPFVRSTTDALGAYVAAHRGPTDHLWVSSAFNSRYYIETGLTSPTGFHHFDPIWFTDSWRTTGVEKLVRLRSELTRGAPEWIVMADDARSLYSSGVLGWICANYVRTPIVGSGHGTNAYLYVTTGRAATLIGTADRVRDENCTGR